MVFAPNVPKLFVAAFILAIALVTTGQLVHAEDTTPTTSDPTPTDPLAQALSIAVRTASAPDNQRRGSDSIDESISRFYHARMFRPVWVQSRAEDGVTLTTPGRILLTVLQTAHLDGLNAEAYLQPAPKAVTATLDAEQGTVLNGLNAYAAVIELRLSRSLLAYAQDLRYGRTPPQDVDPSLYAGRGRMSPETLLHRAASSENIGRFLADLRPPHPQYEWLRHELTRLRRLEINTTIDPRAAFRRTRTDEVVIRAGDRHALISDVRTVLTVLGDASLTGSAPSVGIPAEGPITEAGAVTVSRQPEPEQAIGGQTSAEPGTGTGLHTVLESRYDPALQEAVRRFQRRHGLADDGVIGPNTWRFLRLSLDERRQIVRANMERLRWLPDQLGRRHLFVNIAGQDLIGMENGRPAVAMRVIVGRPKRQTPLLSSQIRTIVLNPTWSIPETVLTKDVLPKIAEDVSYLTENRIDVFDGWGPNALRLDLATIDWADVRANPRKYRFRQRPGEDGALGRMKFDFNNAEAIYLHDTPYKSVFGLSQRARSSGCIRLEDPFAVLRFLLTGTPDGRNERTQRAMALLNTGKTQWVSVAPNVPLYLVYLTAFVDEFGRLQLRDDIYGLDHRLIATLKQRTEIQTAARNTL